jgi:phenylpyruvate tautomerase PptA (4-oxalocrotonate tautomerase family)
MPLVRISVPSGKRAEYLKAVSDGVHQALVEIFKIPADDLFQIITEHVPAAQLDRRKSYLGIDYSDDLMVIQITANDTRTVEQKKALYKGIAERLSKSPGVRTQDILINLVEVKKETWSFGNGEAQYA